MYMCIVYKRGFDAIAIGFFHIVTFYSYCDFYVITDTFTVQSL